MSLCEASGRFEIHFYYRSRPMVRFVDVRSNDDLRAAMNQVRIDFQLLTIDRVDARKVSGWTK